MMTIITKKKIAEAKKMMGAERFCASEYEDARRSYEAETPAWSTLKKYAAEIGLVSEQVPYEWHSDGSMLAELCGIKDGTVFYYTAYHFV